MDIKSARIAAHMTQEELARASSISRIALLRYENGQREPSVSVAAKIATALGCSVDDLVNKKEDAE